jgi:hypothetical protein
VLGVVQAPKHNGLTQAVDDTLAASNYTQDVTETASKGSESEHVVFQAPDRLGGYVQSGGKRQYVYIIGNREYETVAVAASTPTDQLVFGEQATGTANAAVSANPASGFLPDFKTAKHIVQHGDLYTFTLSQPGQVGLFQVTLAGQFVSDFSVTVTSGHQRQHLHLVISSIDSSPSVQLPAGAKVSVES